MQLRRRERDVLFCKFLIFSDLIIVADSDRDFFTRIPSKKSLHAMQCTFTVGGPAGSTWLFMDLSVCECPCNVLCDAAWAGDLVPAAA